MAGRKRKSGPREPNGQPSRRSAEQRYSPVAVRRILDAAALQATDPRLGTEIGRLLLGGDLTARQAGAGWMWDEAVQEYRKAIDAPTVKAGSWERQAKAEGPEEGSVAWERQARVLVRSVSRYEAARAVLDSQGQAVSRAVCLVSEGRGVALLTYEQLQAARAGLDALAAHFERVR